MCQGKNTVTRHDTWTYTRPAVKHYFSKALTNVLTYHIFAITDESAGISIPWYSSTSLDWWIMPRTMISHRTLIMTSSLMQSHLKVPLGSTYLFQLRMAGLRFKKNRTVILPWWYSRRTVHGTGLQKSVGACPVLLSPGQFRIVHGQLRSDVATWQKWRSLRLRRTESPNLRAIEKQLTVSQVHTVSAPPDVCIVFQSNHKIAVYDCSPTNMLTPRCANLFLVSWSLSAVLISPDSFSRSSKACDIMHDRFEPDD